jgi:hypothetical protein
MGLSKTLKIHKTAVELMEVVDETYVQMKHHHKFTIGTTMVQSSIEVLRYINKANHCTKLTDRVEYINQILEEVEFIDTIANFCSNIMCIPIKRSSRIVSLVDNILNQATRWKLYTEKFID